MKLLYEETLRKLWASGKPITRKGITYKYMGRMSYGDYFLEPGPEHSERETFRKGTIHIPKRRLAR